MPAVVAEETGPNFLLVFGAARSGTSWIGKIFDSHPLTLYKHEPDRVLPGVPMAPGLDQVERLVAPVRQFCARLPELDRTHVAGSLPVFRKQYRSWLAQHVHRSSVLSAIAAASFHITLPVLQLARLNQPEVLIVWKSIDSLGRLGLIVRIMENCRAIRITRHPCASISSTLRGEEQRKFSSSVSASEDYGIMRIFLEAASRSRGLTVDHLRQMHPVERMAWIWVLMNEKAFDDTHTIELHHVKNLEHTDGMLIAYLPKEKILFTADFNVPAAGQPVSPAIATLVQNVDRLKLDFDTHVLVHAPNPDRPQTKADLLALAKGTR